MTPRAVRLRNACLAKLARLRGLPSPAEPDFAELDPTAPLASVFRKWEKRHTPPAGLAAIPIIGPRMRSKRAMVFAGILLTGVIGGALGIGFGGIRIAGAFGGDVELDGVVTDIVIADLNAKVLAASEAPDRARVVLTPAELAAVVLRRPGLDNIEARVDSGGLRLRARVDGGRSVEMWGQLQRVRPGLGEYQAVIARGDAVDLGRIAARRRNRSTYRILFPLPSFVTSIRLTEKGGELLVR